MKRFLSLFLAISMLIALLPAVSAEDTGLTIEYDISGVMRSLAMSTASDSKPLTLINASSTKGFFSFFGAIGDLKYPDPMKYRAYGLEFYRNVAPAFELHIPRAGTYKMNVYANRGGDGRVVNIYMKKGATSIDAADMVGTYDCNKTADDTAFGDEKYILQTVKNGADDALIEITEAGDYVFTFLATSGFGTLGSIELIETTGSSAPVFMSAVLGDVTDGTAEVVAGYMSDGSPADLTGATITYASSKPGVATIDPVTGVITNVASGKTEITATVTLDGVSKIARAEYEFIDGLLLKYSIVNVMREQAMTWGKLDKPLTLINNDTTKGFFDFYDSIGVPVYTGNIKYRGGIEFSSTIAPAFRVYIPSPGKYKMSVYANRGVDGRIVDVYKTRDKVSTDDSDKIGTYDCSQITGDTSFTDEKYPLQPVKNGNEDVEFEITEAGEYVFTFKAASMWGTIGGIELINTSVSSEPVCMRPTLNILGGKAQITSCYMSDGSKTDLTGATYSYASSNTSVATIDPVTGVVTDMGEGDTEITATITLADGTVVPAKTIYHFSKRRTIMYDLLGYMKVAGMKWGSSVELSSLTYAFTGNSFAFFESNLDGESHTASTQQLLRYRDSGIQYYKSYIAFEVYIPQGGTYTMNMYNGISTSGSETHVFVKEGEATTDPQYYVGQYTSRDANGDAYATPITVPNVIEGIEIPKAGNYVITFYAPNGTSGIGSFELSVEVNCIKKVEVTAARDELLHNETEQLNIVATRWDGTPMTEGEYNITYESSDEKTVTVNKKGVVKAVGDGTATITVTAWDEIETVKSIIDITAIDNTDVLDVFLEGSEQLYLGGKAKLGLVAMMESGNKLYMPKKDIAYTYEGDGKVSVDADGLIYAEGVGDVTVTAEYDFHGKPLSASKTFNVSIHPGKKEATLFTTGMRDAAKDNSKKYTWARDEVKRVTSRADTYLANAQAYYDMIIGEGIPRACKVGEPNDPNQDKCQYCGVLVTTFSGGWDINPVGRPWKVQCPSCKRVFPSNDFELLLERGLDKQGYYDRDRAIAANAQAVANGEKDALTNELYPEIGDKDENGNYKVASINVGRGLRPGETVEGWGVDDGFGYVPHDENGKAYRPTTATGDVYYYNGHIVEERHNYIAMYLHDTWDIIENSINYLADAYTYTGDIKYGRAGAKILDRIADVYPSYDLTPYFYQTSNYHGGGNAGKIQGRITEAYMAISYGEATDKLWPALTDNEVINFLSAKAEEMGLENDKSSTAKIWENWEKGILYENFDAAKHEMNSGNFGMVQNVVAVTAIALDREPHTTEMIEWIYNTSEKLEDGTVTGGNVDYQLINEVDRDGMGYEVGPGYNQMWISYLEGMANALSKYKGEGTYNTYKHPKFAMMYLPYDVINLTNSHTAQIGDSGAIASVNYASALSMHITGFKLIQDETMKKRLARYIYLRNGNTTEGLKYGIYESNPERIQQEIKEYVSEDEVYLESDMLAGYGFAVLRAGKNYTSASSSTAKNTMRDFWMYFGNNGAAHAHQDTLNIGMEAYGLNLSPDLGYPETTGSDPNRWQWVMATVSHNTVVVDEKSQDSSATNVSTPLHFDDTENVKLIDVSTPDAYKQTEEYRRTMVMVKANDDVSYGVDFFRVIGGDKHTFSFHAQSENATYINDNEMVKQVDENGNYEGTYAGRDVKYGSDPNGNGSPKYPRGYTWMTKVRQDMAPGKDFSVDFAITDYRKAVPDNKNIHLRMTQINDFDLSEVAIVGGDTLKNKPENKEMPETLEYVLSHRRGKSLDSLFTTVYEPYKGERYIESIETVNVTTDEAVGEKDVARAVKVTHTNGRVDYVVYSTNNSVIYNVADVFDFRGFVGVYSTNKDGAVIYKYVNDGDIIDGETKKTATFEGVVSEFQRDLAFDNYIDVEMSCEDTSELIGKFVFIDNEKKLNAAYKILGVEDIGEGKLRFDIGNVSLISGHKDVNNIDSGYVYNISAENTFTISRSYSMEYLPDILPVANTTASAGTSVSVTVSATAYDGGSVRYIGTVLPRGASVNSETGKVTWKPDSSQIGENHFEITAEDSAGRQSTVHFYITVYGSTTDGSSPDQTDEDNKTETPPAGGGGGGGGGGAESTDKPDDSGNTDEADNGETSDNTENAPETSGETDSIRFTDLSNHSWAEAAINVLAADGIIKGTSASTFAPSANITRADFALLLVRAFKLTSDNTENFADVSAADYFATELAVARNNGIVGGIGENKFAPRNSITRQDMMVIVYRAMATMNVALSENANPQNDDFDMVADYAREAVSALIGAGIVNGKNNLIAPSDYTTRAEVAVLIKRILDYVK